MTTILVTVVEAEDDDPSLGAYLHGLRTAATAARPLTRQERRLAVLRLLEQRPGMSDRAIARAAGVSPTTVGKCRQAAVQVDTATDDEEPGDRYLSTASALELADRFFQAMERVIEARGLGIADALLGDRTAKRLAHTLAQAYGNDALRHAVAYRDWMNGAVAILRTPPQQRSA
jgi:hypothetical protein